MRSSCTCWKLGVSAFATSWLSVPIIAHTSWSLIQPSAFMITMSGTGCEIREYLTHNRSLVFHVLPNATTSRDLFSLDVDVTTAWMFFFGSLSTMMRLWLIFSCIISTFSVPLTTK